MTREHIQRATRPHRAHTLGVAPLGLRVRPRSSYGLFRNRTTYATHLLSKAAGSESRKARQSSPLGAASTPRGWNPEGHRSSVRRLRTAHRSSRHLRRRLVETMTNLHVSRDTPSEGPPLVPHATPHDEVDEGSPPRRSLEHPMVVDSESFEGIGVPFALLEPTKIRAFASPREGKRIHLDQDAFCRQEPGA